MKAKFIYVFLTCLMIGGQFSLSAQNQVNKDKRQRHTGAVHGTPDQSDGEHTDVG